MKKLIFSLAIGGILFIPHISFAANLSNLNGLTTATQNFATSSSAASTMHMRIQSITSTHSFLWDGTPWLLNQGGTGTTLFATGSVPFISNNKFFEDNSHFFWDATNRALSLGGAVSDLARLTITASGTQAALKIISNAGTTSFFVGSGGNVGVGTTTTPQPLSVQGNASFSGDISVTNISATGKIGVGTTSPGQKLTVTGTIESTSGGFKFPDGTTQSTAASPVVGVPAGMVISYASSTAPSGWLIADGSEVSRTTYAELFSVIGTAYGIGDGSTTFNLPNLKGRISVGQDSSQTEFTNLGATGGEKTHTLTVAEIPAHSHSITTFDTAGGQGLNNFNRAGSPISVESGSAGGGNPHNNLQPYIVLNYLIKY